MVALNQKHEWKKRWRTLKRQGLIGAVVQVLNREGVKGLTMDNVANEAGVAKGTLYAHFKNKQDLLQTAIEASFAPLVEELNHLLLDSEIPPDRKLAGMILRHLSYFEENRSFFRMLLYDRQVAQERLKRHQSCRYREFLQTTASVIADGIADGIFRPVDPNKVSAMLVEANIAVINQRLAWDEPGPVEEDAKLLADLFIFGIAGESLRKRGTREAKHERNA